MVGRRKYDDGCAVAHGLDLIGERWALLVVRDLVFGPKRFTDLRTGMPGTSSDVLAQRLRELQDAGVVQRRKLAPPAGSWVYELTAWGAQLEPIITQLGLWASSSPTMRHDAPIGVDSLILSLKALFDPRTAQRFRATIALRLHEQDFRVQITTGRLEVARGQPPRADVTIETDPDTLAGLLWADRRLAEAQRAGDVLLHGDAATADRFLTLFPLPEPAAAP